MTTRHLIDGVMRATKSINHNKLCIKLGIEQSTLCRLYHRGGAMNLATFDQIQQASGVSLDQLMAWYRMPGNQQ